MWATDDACVALEVTWMFYQDIIQAYGRPKKSEGKKLMERIINTLREGVPKRGGGAGSAESEVVASV